MLNINPIVQVDISVGASVTIPTVYDIGAILTSEPGATTPLTKATRFVSYSSIDELENGVASEKPAYASTTETYKAAAKYFGANPAPGSLIVIFADPGDPEASPAVEAESPVVAIQDALDKGCEFYGLYYIPLAGISAADAANYAKGIVSALSSIERGVLFVGFTGTVSTAVADGTLPKDLFDISARRAVCMHCASEVHDAAGLMGVAMGYGANASTSPFALCYKEIATATADSISQTEVDAVKAINANVYVARTRAGAKVENGSTSSGLRYDEVLYIDMIANDLQTNLYDMIANSQTKLPLTDSTTAQFLTEIYSILEGYYNIGVLADATWRGSNVAEIENGSLIEHGYYAYADSFDNQSVADRAAHKAMPITIIICLSGSVESIVINLDVQT